MNLIQSIQSYRWAKHWTVFHILLGIVATFFSPGVIIWFYFFLLSSLPKILVLNKNLSNLVIAEVLIYCGSFELIGRISKSSPYIPYELSKYLMMLLCILGILLNLKSINRGRFGILILLLLLPSFFIDESSMVTWRDIRFNIFGIINIGLGIIFFSSIIVNKTRLFSWLKLLAFPCITVLVFTIIKTPSFEEVEFSLGANFSTSGEFGSNQVSTVLGLGAFIMIVSILSSHLVSGYRVIDFLLLLAFVLQGLLTFSRGGMIGGVIGALIILFFVAKLSKNEQRKMRILNPKKYLIPVVTSIILIFIIGDSISDGLLSLRYQGETLGTTRGGEKTLNEITTGRSDLFLGDLALWSDYPITGVGAAASKYLRPTHRGVVAHVELSRLLAEHGIFAIGILIMLTMLIIKRVKSAPDKLSKGLVLALFTVAIFTSFHAATRTFMSPLLISMGSVLVLREDSKRVLAK